MNKNRVTSIDGIKSIAFLLVFISHIPRLNLSANPFGAAGVEIYFICSGFLAHYSQSNRGDCPKTKDSILKVENDDRQKTVVRFYGNIPRSGRVDFAC